VNAVKVERHFALPNVYNRLGEFYTVVSTNVVGYCRDFGKILGIGLPMDLRSKISDSLKTAMKARDAIRLSTLRLISAAIKDLDIALRGEGRDDGVTDAEILGILGKMVKQRLESARAYEEGGRLELAEQELSEIKIIEDFLPRQLSEAETAAAVDAAIAETGAESIRDMGKVMAVLKGKYTGQMDFGSVGPKIKDMLA